LLALLWPAVQPQFSAAAMTALRTAAATAFDGAPVLDPMHWRLPWPRPLPVVPAAVPWQAGAAPRSGDVEIEFSWAGETVRHVGTLVHRMLQKIAEDRAGWSAERIGAAKAGFVRTLLTLGVPASDVQAAADRVVQALTRSLADARGQWVLQAHAQAFNELKLTGVFDGEIINVAIDRSFVVDGVRWIIDYKTSVHEGGELEAFLDQERERYGPQLARYAQLMAALGPEPVHCGLYFPLLGAWRAWPA
jgi:hypothetical protein